VIIILDDASSHIVISTKVGKSRGFSTLELSSMTLVFLPPNVISVVQPLDQGIIESFKFNPRRNFCGWVLSQYDDATLTDLRKVVLNIGQAIMWSYEVWSELDAQIVKNCWRMARILPTWCYDSKLRSGDDEMSIETYIQMERE
jgi:hypothetical protein